MFQACVENGASTFSDNNDSVNFKAEEKHTHTSDSGEYSLMSEREANSANGHTSGSREKHFVPRTVVPDATHTLNEIRNLIRPNANENSASTQSYIVGQLENFKKILVDMAGGIVKEVSSTVMKEIIACIPSQCKKDKPEPHEATTKEDHESIPNDSDENNIIKKAGKMTSIEESQRYALYVEFIALLQ